jgi:hypothetical protein
MSPHLVSHLLSDRNESYKSPACVRLTLCNHGTETISVILRVPNTVLQVPVHDFHCAYERRRFPINLGAEAIAIAHDVLRREIKPLHQSLQIFEGGEHQDVLLNRNRHFAIIQSSF